MRKNILKGFLTVAIVFGTAAFTGVFADGFPPPPPGGHQQSGDVPGGACPIDGGALMLLTMAVGYGSKKVYEARKRLAE
jgi:hypothetical protein